MPINDVFAGQLVNSCPCSRGLVFRRGPCAEREVFPSRASQKLSDLGCDSGLKIQAHFHDEVQGPNF